MTKNNQPTALITGACGGIGQELLRQFGAQGSRIAALDQKPEVLELANQLAEEGLVIEAAVANIGDFNSLQAAIAGLADKLGPPAILVNNAGFSSQTSLLSTTIDSWQADIQSNLNGTYHVTHCVLPLMQTQRQGAIINIASVNGLVALGDPAYSAAKAGMISLTKSLALEYGKFAIRANVICPGTVRTPIWTERVKRNPEILQQLQKWYPLGRIAEPADIANAALFLASDAAAAITGVVLPVDCGLTAGNILMAEELTAEWC